MTEKPNQAHEPGSSRQTPGSRRVVSDETRRRLIKGGLSATPAILTLTSRPVLGFENACMSPSRMISGNHSGFTGPTTCGGNGRTFYSNEANAIQKPSWTTWSFTVIFGNTHPYDSSQAGSDPQTLGPIFLDSFAGHDNNANSTSGFASFIIAAYLNALNNVGSVETVLAPAQVVHMWNDVVGSGSYCPQINMCWNATGVVNYLKNSGIVPS